MKTHIAIHGAAGRMGQRLVALTREDPELTLAAAVDRVAGPGITTEIPLSALVHCVIDFSSPDGVLAILKTCVDRKLPLVVATTGLDSEHKAEIAAAAHEIPILLSPSMSLVVNLLFKLTRLAGEALAGKGFDVEIVERHHRLKKDSPSGTAMQFAKIVQEAMQQSKLVHGREGLVGERTDSEIGVHAIRGGDSVGEHTIIFTALGETMELVHKGSSRDSYARGALLAAKYLAGQGAGLYTMSDVLGL